MGLAILQKAACPIIVPILLQGRTMPFPNSISADRLLRLIGRPNTPALIDVRPEEDFAADERLIPGSIRRSHREVTEWDSHFAARSAIVICQRGQQLAHGTAAWLRKAGAKVQVLEGGFEEWKSAGYPLVPVSKLPARDPRGRTVWVTRARPKVDRIACPWLIRRFVDPAAVFLYVARAEVAAVGEHFNAAPFDIDSAFFGHRGELCTFDVMITEFSLSTPALLQLATIVRAADTGRLDLCPEAPGLLAASLGLSRMHDNDLEQLEAGMALYDAFYRWCRDATEETHER